METYGKILLIAMPAFLLLVLLEKLYGVWKGFDTVRNMDMISSLSSGITNVTKDVLGMSVAIISYGWMVDHLSVTKVEESWVNFVIAFIALDFAGYWIHRLAHEYNILWNNHIVHHSSEEFNLACALRQSISVFFRIFTFFLLPAALLGVPEQVIAVVAPLHLFAQFWYHTRHIDKMGWLEHIIVTPSHHRVHHAINPQYMDKNYAQIFIVWDKLFGTFQEELKEVPPVYGITRPAATWNPIKINFQHAWLLMRDAIRAKSWRDKIRIWFMPTGWRPEDVAAKYPVNKIEDVYHFEKYNPTASAGLQVWSWVQILSTLLYISYLFGNIAYINDLNPTYIYWYGLFVFVGVYAYTDLMDRNKSAIFIEALRALLAFAFILTQSDWFGAEKLFPSICYVLIGYHLIALLFTGWFTVKHFKEDEKAALLQRTLG